MRHLLQALANALILFYTTIAAVEPLKEKNG